MSKVRLSAIREGSHPRKIPIMYTMYMWWESWNKEIIVLTLRANEANGFHRVTESRMYVSAVDYRQRLSPHHL